MHLDIRLYIVMILKKKTKNIFLIFTDNVSVADYNYNTSCGHIRYVLQLEKWGFTNS